MKEFNEIDFDSRLRSIMEGAREDAPDSVWEGVSASLKGAKAASVWRWMPASALALASIAAALMLCLPHNESSSIVSEVENTPAEILAQTSAPSPDASNQAVAPLPEQSTMHTGSQIAPAEDTETSQAEAVVLTAEESDEFVETPDKKSVENQAEKKKAKSDERPSKQEIDPFALMLAEDAAAKSVSKNISLDVRGIIGSNEINGSSAAAFNGRKGAAANGSQLKDGTGVVDQSESEFGIPLSLGVGVFIPLGKSIALGTGVDYSCLTRTFSGTYYQIGSGASSTEVITGDIQNTQHYIGIPLNLYYRILEADKLKLYAFAGGEVEKGLADNYRISSSDSQVFNYSTGVKGVQLSAGLGLGAEFLLTKHLGLFIDPSARYYFNCDQPKSIRTQKVLMFSVTAGLRFDL